MSCIFCDIVAGNIPSKKVYEDEKVLAFHDIAPQADAHVIVIPKDHISSAAEINSANSALIAHIFECIPAIAGKLDLTEGFRVITNIGPHGRQSVHHLHFHILGGRELDVKMG